MALVWADRVRETTTTTGPGALALLGAVLSYRAFSSALSVGDTAYGFVAHQTLNEWEVTVLTLQGDGTLARQSPPLASSNGGLAVSFSAGVKDVMLDLPASVVAALFVAPYVSLSAIATLPNERTLAAGTNISLSDGGPGQPVTISAASGTTLPVADSTALVQGSSDTTKRLRFEIDGFTAGATRVLTPPDQDGTLALLERAQTFTAQQTFSAAPSAPFGTQATSQRFGPNSGSAGCTGGDNTCLGDYAGSGLVAGSANTLLGSAAGWRVNAGTQNTLIGAYAGAGITTQSRNVCVGQNAGALLAGSDNVLIGTNAGQALITTQATVVIGVGIATGASSANFCTAVGAYSAAGLTTGGSNVFYGTYAGYYCAGGQGNTYLGFSAGGSNISPGDGANYDYTIHLGYQSQARASREFAVSPNVNETSWYGYSDTGSIRPRASLQMANVDNTDATRKYRAVWGAWDTGFREAFRIEGNGSGAVIGFLGASAVTRRSGDVAQGLIDLGLFSTATLSDLLSALTAAEIAITGATTATLGRMHVCSGTTADYTLTLPAVAGNAGKFVGLRMAGGLTKLVTIDGNGSETIDGATTRVMWADETAILFCDGTGWAKLAGKTVPMRAVMRLSANQGGIATGTITKINVDRADVNNGLLADTTNKRINIRRGNPYLIQAVTVWSNLSAASARCITQARKNGTTGLANAETYGAAGGYPSPNLVVPAESLAAGDYLELVGFHNSGANETAYGSAAGDCCTLSVIELPDW